jgi:uncharacterized protein (TIGR00369 family)
MPTEEFRGFNQKLGFRMADWSLGHAVLELPLQPWHLNRSGIVHGGIIASIIDAAAGYTGIYPLQPGGPIRRAITVALTTSYVGQAKAGTITCTARQQGGGRTIFTATAEVHGPDGTLLAVGQGTYRYIAETPR